MLVIDDLWQLSLQDRHRFARLVQAKSGTRVTAELGPLLEQYQQARNGLQAAVCARTAWVASNFLIAGITVTRAAMDQELLSQIAPDFVIVEEAAEVLEGNAPVRRAESVSVLIDLFRC